MFGSRSGWLICMKIGPGLRFPAASMHAVQKARVMSRNSVFYTLRLAGYEAGGNREAAACITIYRFSG